MIRVDMAELEKLSILLTRNASQAEETLCRLRHVSAEMQEDLELALYEPTGAALEAVALAVETLTRCNDTLQSLKGTIALAGERYRELEQQHKNALNRMIVTMNTAATEYQAAMATTVVPQAEHSDAQLASEAVEALVADSAESLQAANVAAIRDTAQHLYPVQDVQEL